MRALPSSADKSAAWSKLLLPQAQANPILVYLAASAGGAAVTYYFSNEDQCKDIGSAIDSCGKQRRKIRQFIAKKQQGDAAKSSKNWRNKKAADDDDENKDWEELKAKKLTGACPIQSIDEELDNDTADLLSEMARGSETTKYRWAHCFDDRKDRALACENDVAELAKEWCLNLSVSTAVRLKLIPPKGQSAPPANSVK